MPAKVTKSFKGRASGAMHCITYKPGDIIQEERMAMKAVRNKWAEEITPAAAKAADKEKVAPANKAEAAAPSNKARDPRAPALPPSPQKPK